MKLSINAAAMAALAGALLACSPQPDTGTDTIEAAEAERFTVMVGGTQIGALDIALSGDGYAIDYEYRNNGRGPTLTESIALDAEGLPLSWTIDGNTTFGNPVEERYALVDSEARWTDTTGSGEALPDGPAFYVPQNASPYWLAIAARALMNAQDNALPALPGGTLRLDEIDTLDVSNGSEARSITAYALSGTSLDPTYFLMSDRAFFGVISPRFSVLEAGFEAEDERLRALAAEYGAQRYEDIQSRFAHDYGAPVRIRNVRVFDPASQALGEPVSVVIEGDTISAIDPLDVPTGAGEVEIDGAGGSLIPGLFEMHGHMGEDDAILNIAAGVTSVRDMGNNNDVLSALIDRIESGEIAGPRVFRSGFIEGRSPFNSNNGILVESEDEAVAAVETYAASGEFFQIKIYNSMNPDWVPAMIAAAREHGLRVTGHVPAFSNADAMVAAGYDEMTHINQVMLGWVLDEGEDTRTLLRLTALKRLPGLDLQGEAVQSTLDAMVENGVAIDPTLAIHEALLLSRNGQLSPGSVDYVDHMPVSVQRSARSAWADISTPEDDAAYRGAFDQILATLRQMHERGIFMVPGTDLGGSFAYHRELELYQEIGMTPAEILAWASHGMAEYLGVGDTLGSIEPGKRADFFLVPGDPTADLRDIKTIAMVAADGTIYFPTEIYPEFGIRPFVDLPAVRTPR
ncbi:amidohydrolase family protein [Maricaulis sp.]|uniref:amidohydrolase family protein n=1 Tax=Maricaulis sp. TaxID=1486257 RepID=UPI00260D0031|nr:amidohydrolase family protein [Maricaulis sp.]